ncbi:MAG: MFS transporter [Chloroflexi bacterium]|nr:MFS transporter [Chloroflexota bacterium]
MTPSSSARHLPALASPAFRILLVGVFVSNVGTWMQVTALGWLVLRLTGSAGSLGLAAFAGSAPALLLTLYAGALADRVDQRRILLWTQVALALFAGLLAVLVQADAILFWHVLVLAVLAGIANALASPAFQAIVPGMVDRSALGNAIALNSAQFNLARIVGPAVAGILIGVVGEAASFWLNAASFGAVIVALLAIRMPTQAAITHDQAGFWSNLGEGIDYVRERRQLVALLLLAAAPAVLILPYLALLPIFAADLGIGAAGLGLLTASIGIGALVGAIGVALLRRDGASGRTVAVGLTLMALTVAVFAVSRNLLVTCGALAILGASQVAYYTGTNTLVQLLSPARLRGRILSFYVLTSIGVSPLGSLVAGGVAEVIGAPLTLVAGGGLTIIALGVVLAWYPDLWRLRVAAVETPEGALRPVTEADRPPDR